MDPFVVLDVEEGADKATILKAVTGALRDKRHDVRTVAAAQKELFDPLTRAMAEFRYRIDRDICAGPGSDTPTDRPDLERLALD